MQHVSISPYSIHSMAQLRSWLWRSAGRHQAFAWQSRPRRKEFAMAVCGKIPIRTKLVNWYLRGNFVVTGGWNGQIRTRGKQDGGERDAPAKTRNFALGKRRQRRRGKKPKAGHCHWLVGSARQGCESTEEKIQLTLNSRASSQPNLDIVPLNPGSHASRPPVHSAALRRSPPRPSASSSLCLPLSQKSLNYSSSVSARGSACRLPKLWCPGVELVAAPKPGTIQEPCFRVKKSRTARKVVRLVWRRLVK